MDTNEVQDLALRNMEAVANRIIQFHHQSPTRNSSTWNAHVILIASDDNIVMRGAGGDSLRLSRGGQVDVCDLSCQNIFLFIFSNRFFQIQEQNPSLT
jgi:hypothetical protein